MASAFHLQLRAAELQNMSERAGEAFGHCLDLDENERKPRAARMPAVLIFGLGTFLLAVAFALT